MKDVIFTYTFMYAYFAQTVAFRKVSIASIARPTQRRYGGSTAPGASILSNRKLEQTRHNSGAWLQKYA